MKEADDDAGQPAPASPAGPDAGNDKLNKDMKGLVYQGGPTGGEASPATYPEEEPNIGGAKEKGPELSEESSTILNFTEKDSRLKAIALFAIVIIVIAVVAYLVLHSKVLKTSSTVSTTTVIISNSPTSTVAQNFNTTYIGGLNTFYNYTGPSSINGVPCGKSKVSTVDASYTESLNATATFYIKDPESTGVCPLTITKYVVTTPGFRVVSVTPVVPVSIPGNSSVFIVIKIQTPVASFTGPLSLTIDEK